MTSGMNLQQQLRHSFHSVRVRWRTTVRPRWHDVRPVVLIATGITVLILGTIGFSQLHGEHLGFLDSLYRSITLFGLSGAVPPPVPLPLQIARIIAPILTGYAAIGTILALTREQARVLGIRLFVREHVAIAGLGTTGWHLASTLVDREPVVVIEANPTHERLPAARAHGVRVLIGEAGEEALLRRAGLAHARALVVACGTDGTNVEVAVAAARLSEERRAPLTIFVHLRDLDMWSSLAAEGPAFGFRPSTVRIEYFNVFATAAQLMLERDMPAGIGEREAGGPRRPHILLVSLQGIGEQLVLQIARMWRTLDPEPQDELRMTVVGPEAANELERLRDRYPALDDYCAVKAREMPIESAKFQSGEAMAAEPGSEVTQAYVCLLDEGDALIAALALHSRPEAAAVPVTVAVADHTAGAGILLAPEEGRFAHIRPFGVITAVTSDELLLRGTNELLARAQHSQWLRREEIAHRQAIEDGEKVQPNANMKAWEDLDERIREDNRRFADDLHAKLGLIECMLVPMPLRSPRDEVFTFSAQELDLLSRHEHERWMESKLRDGWRYGAKRDNDKMIHDQLKPWEELDETNRDKDRNAVRELPHMLELAGFKIQRKSRQGRQMHNLDSGVVLAADELTT